MAGFMTHTPNFSFVSISKFLFAFDFFTSSFAYAIYSQHLLIPIVLIRPTCPVMKDQ